MEGTKKLMEEHRIIDGVLNGLETVAARLRSGLPVRPGFFLDCANFIKGFADGCHHQKEEGELFPAMESAGVARQGGPIGVMLAEHEEGRRLTRAMREAAEQLEAGQTQAKDQIVASAESFVSLLRLHIAKEDRVLFPMAEQVLDPARQEEISSAIEQLGREQTRTGAYEEYLALAQSLDKESRQ
jgi:hemerythrin-like domain-containing protein